MKRILALILVGMTLMLAACSSGATKKTWGGLEVALGTNNPGPDGFVADAKITNNTSTTQLLQYNPPAKYTLVVTQGSKEIFRADYGSLKEPSLLNILPKASESHIVGWSYQDQTGKKVPPGKYQVQINIHALTTAAKGETSLGPISVTVK